MYRKRPLEVTEDKVPFGATLALRYKQMESSIRKNPFLVATRRSEVPIPASHCDEQARVFSPAFEVLADAIGKRAFPGASVAVTDGGKLVALNSFGRFTYQASAPAVESNTIFDLASVTKVVATTSMAMILNERAVLDLEMPVAGILTKFRGDDSRRERVTFRHLLAHSSGLPAYEKLFLGATDQDECLSAAFSVPLKYAPGVHVEYTDIGFIVLGAALERIANEPLDRFCQREVFEPLGMSHTTYNPPACSKTQIPPTADDRTFRERIIQGEVQDENASVLGGVAGHAGLFSNAPDMATFAEAILNGGGPIARPETVEVFTERQTSPPGTTRALGWDMPSGLSQSGSYFSPSSFGHLGYTGASLWIDPERRITVTLLTNRTWPDASNQAIRDVRRQFHDQVIKALGARR
jgi:serine-type D-Ala-D-Ala carboxypeptidase